jgi:hypothetical protein
MPLSRVALEGRLSVIRNKQPSVVKASVQFYETRPKAMFAPYPENESCALGFMPIITHWTGFEFNSLDLSGALQGPGSGKVVFTQPDGVLPFGIKLKPMTFVLKDGRGGYWLRTILLARGWKGVEQRMAAGKYD